MANAGSITSVVSSSSTIASLQAQHTLSLLPVHDEQPEQYQTIADAAIQVANRSLSIGGTTAGESASSDADSIKYSGIAGRLNKNANRALPGTPALLAAAAAAAAVAPPLLPPTPATSLDKPYNRNLSLGLTDTDYAPWSEHASDTYYGVPAKPGATSSSGPSLSSFTPLPPSVPRVHSNNNHNNSSGSNHHHHHHHHQRTNQSMNHSTGSDDTYFDDASFDTLDPYSDEEVNSLDEDEDDEEEGNEFADDSIETKKSVSLSPNKPPPPPPPTKPVPGSPATKPKPPPRKPDTTTTAANPASALRTPIAGSYTTTQGSLQLPSTTTSTASTPAAHGVDASFDARDITVRAGDPSKGEAATVITVHRAITAGTGAVRNDQAKELAEGGPLRKRRSSGDGMPVKTFGDKLAAFQRGTDAYRSQRQVKQQPATAVASKLAAIPQATPVASTPPVSKPQVTPVNTQPPPPQMKPIKPKEIATPAPTPKTVAVAQSAPSKQQPFVKTQPSKPTPPIPSRTIDPKPIASAATSSSSSEPNKASDNEHSSGVAVKDLVARVSERVALANSPHSSAQATPIAARRQIYVDSPTSALHPSTPQSLPVQKLKQTEDLPSPTPRPRERTREPLKDKSSDDIHVEARDNDDEEEEEDVQNTGHHIMKQFENSFNKDDFVVTIHKVCHKIFIIVTINIIFMKYLKLNLK